MINRKKDGIEYYQFEELEKMGIENCYTSRLNDADFSINQKKEKLDENYLKICKCLNIDRNMIVRPYQSHTDIIKRVDSMEKQEYKDVDGLITDKPGIYLMLAFADCTPIFIYDPVNKAVGNIHSGWKGTVKKIAVKAVLKMKEEYNSNPEDLIVCLGPCIRQCHFEVDEDVKEIFEKEFSYLNRNSDIIKNTSERKYLIDTSLINRLILEEIGVKSNNIIDSKICTVCNSELFHSYRVDKEQSGRNAAIIGIKTK